MNSLSIPKVVCKFMKYIYLITNWVVFWIEYRLKELYILRIFIEIYTKHGTTFCNLIFV